MAKTSPTQRTLAMLRRTCSHVAIVEKWIPQTCQRKDVWGFGDILALDGQPGSLLVQCTSGSNVSARVHKIAEECAEAAGAWLLAGNRIQVIGFRKRKPRGQKVARWEPRIVHVTLESLAEGLEAQRRADLAVGHAEQLGEGEAGGLTGDAGRAPSQDALPGHPEQARQRAARMPVLGEKLAEDDCPLG